MISCSTLRGHIQAANEAVILVFPSVDQIVNLLCGFLYLPCGSIIITWSKSKVGRQSWHSLWVCFH